MILLNSTVEVVKEGITLLAVGTAWFWIVISAAMLGIIFLLEQEDNGGSWSTAVCVGTLLLLYFFGAGRDIRDLLDFIKYNPGTVIAAFVGYILAGVAWSVAKWYFFVLRARDKWLEDSKRYHNSLEIPKASNYKGRITSWMFYWPFSAVWTLLNEPVRRIFINLFRNLEATYNRISANVFMNEEVRAVQQQRESEQAAREDERKQRRNS